jgi:hypothetical protein
MYWLVTSSSVTACQSHAEAQALLRDVLETRRAEGCTVWPPFRTDGFEEIHLVTWSRTARTEHVYITGVQPRGVVRDGESYDI